MILKNFHSLKELHVDTWNSLPAAVVEAPTLNTFKNRLDKWWKNQEVLYDYQKELSGTGNRSSSEISI